MLPFDILSVETWILVMTVAVLIRLYIYQRWKILKNLKIPHDPPTLMCLGNMGELMKSVDAIYNRDLIDKKKFGCVYGYYIGLQPRICISDPHILKQIYIKEFSTFTDRSKTFSRVGGKEMNTTLEVASGKHWKRIRSTSTPTFSTVKLRDMMVLVDQCADKMINNLKKTLAEKEGRFSTKDFFGSFSMDVICSAAFSVNVNCQDGNSDVVEKSKTLFEKSLFSNPAAFIFVLFPWTERIAEIFNYSLFGKDFVNYYKSLLNVVIAGKKNSENQRVDILQQMLKYEITDEEAKKGPVRGLTRSEILGNSVLMILAGYETTANTIIFLAYCLTIYKEVQEKVRSEIKEIVEKYGDLTYEAVNNLKYLDLCMKESQRIYGALPRSMRYCSKDITIDNVHIPAGMHVEIPVYGMNHDEEYWDSPWDFKPERFEDMSKIDPVIFQPFGAGPRNCIGMRLAILEVKIAICKILQDFDLSACEDTPAPPLDVTFKASMQPKKEIFLKIRSLTKS